MAAPRVAIEWSVTVSQVADTRLGKLLIDAGVLDAATLERMVAEQKGSPKRLGDLLVERGLVTQTRLAHFLSFRLACPWVSPKSVDIPPALLALVPAPIAIEHRLVPVYLRAVPTHALYVATDDPTDELALAAVEAVAGVPVRPMVATTSDMREALATLYGAPRPAPQPPPSARKDPPPVPKSVAASAPAKPVEKADEPDHEHEELDDADVIGNASIVSADAAKPPVVLVVNAPGPFEMACRAAALAVGAQVEVADLVSAADLATAHTLLAVAVTDDVFAFDRSGLTRLALESDALLVVWSEDLEAKQLEPLLRKAIARRSPPKGRARPHRAESTA
jgi:hypothetical protein